MRPGRTDQGRDPWRLRRCTVLPGETMMQLTMDYDSLQKAARASVSGVGVVMEATPPAGPCLPAHRRASYYYARILRSMHAVPRRHRMDVPHAHAHRRRPGDARRSLKLKAAAGQTKATPSVVIPAKPRRGRGAGFLRHYWDEFEYFIRNGARSSTRRAEGRALKRATPVNPTCRPTHHHRLHRRRRAGRAQGF